MFATYKQVTYNLKTDRMEYYGIVSKIKKEHKSGVYTKIQLSNDKVSNVVYSMSAAPFIKASHMKIVTSTLFVLDIVAKYRLNRKKNGSKLQLQKPISSNNKILIIPNDGLGNNYNLDDSFNYGLFDDCLLKNKAFETLMKSKGGATLNILERSDLPPDLFHHAGPLAKFNEGLYIAHPKDETKLIPLNNSNKLIQSLILEETMRAYEALGAKSIKIHDLTSIDADMGGKAPKAQAKARGEYKKEVLREKTFGKGTFDPERAKKDKLLIFDIPAVKSTIEARIEGNQITEKFTEDINLSLGLDVSVLKLFEANSNFNYQRKWSFEVEFYDKNDLA